MIKRIIILLTLIAGIISPAFSQIITKAKATGLPAPKVQIVLPADLQITEINLVSAQTNTATKTVLVTVQITVKNNGATNAPASKVAGYFQKANQQGSAWTSFSNYVDFPAVNGGATVSKQCLFKIPANEVGVRQINFRAQADATVVVKESAETNNYSQGILIAL